MKLLMVATLYVIGAIINGLWAFGTKQDLENYIKGAYEIKEMQLVPDTAAKILILVSIIFTCLMWPIAVIGEVFKVFKELFKSG